MHPIYLQPWRELDNLRTQLDQMFYQIPQTRNYPVKTQQNRPKIHIVQNEPEEPVETLATPVETEENPDTWDGK